MAPASQTSITFIVTGQERSLASRGAARDAGQPTLPAGLTQGRVKHSVVVGAQRGGGAELRVTAVPGEDVVVLHIVGGPALVLHPENARDLMLAQQGEIKRTRSAKGEDEPAPDEVKVPVQLQWRGLEEPSGARGATRGFLGDVLLSLVEVITGVAKDPAADFVAAKVVERFDDHVDEGIYALGPDALTGLKGSLSKCSKLPPATEGQPLLVFVHGTFSDTSGTFGKLWSQHPTQVQRLFAKYENRVYALDHATLGVSPITNALTLARALPPDARLHLVTHSRGGLVAEVLARVCANPDLSSEEFKAVGEAYASQRKDLKDLAQVVKKNKIRVERIVRVACPARGTLLASKRLDAYISVFKWTLELAGIPVAPALVDFLGEVAQRRADPMKIPGLAAQIPDSPLVQWLHAVDKPIDSQLRVVAGDIEGDSITSWLKMLLADAFYWTDNDFVVHTGSMYGGMPRASGASFLLDQGGKVSHFNYFTNESSAGAIVNALIEDDPRGFRPIGPLSWAGESSTGVRAARLMRADGKKPADRPALFLLPGILGSNLKVDGKRIWLGWRFINGITRLVYKPGKPDGVEPDGPISVIYERLSEFLSETHEVVDFAFDWRKPLEEEARRLADEVKDALDEREKSGQPVRIIAHSMGGLVGRVMQLERPEVWKRMMSRPGARMLMLGTPNGGSWAPMQVLSGDDTFGNTLMAFGAPFQGQATRALMAGLPGFMQLQAGLLDSSLRLDKAQTWQELAKRDLAMVREHSWWHNGGIQLREYEWGLPSKEVLDQAVALRKRLDEQRDTSLAVYSDKLLLVIGKSPLTPDGYELAKEGLVYREAQDSGDGRVTLASAQLPGVRTWIVNCEHDQLPNDTEAFKAYRELLENGTTGILSPLMASGEAPGASVTTPTHVLSRPSRARIAIRPPEMTRALLSRAKRAPQATAATARGALRITVVNGDLKFVRHPLMIGHYRSTRLTGTELVMNTLVDGVMKEALKAGLYPDLLGSHQVFVNTHHDPEVPRHMPWPEAVIVVGLGEEGKLRATDLVQAVRQATIAWSQRVTEKPEGTPAVFDLAATLIGSGGTGISAGQSAQLIAEGVREANQRLTDCHWPSVGHLQLIEIYLDRASEAWRALQVQATATPASYQITETILPSPGALRHTPDQGYRGVDYDFVTVLSQKKAQADIVLSYTLDTKRARTEVRAQATQGRLVRKLVVTASNDRNTDVDIRRALFRLLVPVELEPFFGGTSEMVIELDSHTAGIPWELLDTNVRGGGDTRPWAIRAKLTRKLRTPEFRAQVMDAGTDESVLVIGEPECDPKESYARLPGARDEANAVFKLLAAPGALGAGKVTALISPDDSQQFGANALTIMNTLLARDWRIVHISGHGEPPEKIGPEPRKPGDPEQTDGDPRGVVLSGYTFLGPREIHSMRVVPELVFVNCCHLAARNIAQLAGEHEPQLGMPYDRPRFAATVAEALIKIGVRCVIAAGWAVDDAAAKIFATTFYDALLRQRRFIEAVGEAREAAWNEGGNTWAAYQCYGDPDWIFRRQGADAQSPTVRLAEKFAGVASPSALELALDTLTVESQYQKATPDGQRAKIRYLEARFGKQWGGIGSVAEAFGKAWTHAGDKASAVAWYKKALAANDGTASIKVIEQLHNLQVRLAWETVRKALDHRDKSQQQLARLPRGRNRDAINARAARQRQHASANRAVRNSAIAARKQIGEAINALQKLVAVHTSSERQSLLASAYKRLAMIDDVLGRPVTKSIRSMQFHCGLAEDLARAGNLADLFYPGLNRMAAELVLKVTQPRWKGFDGSAVSAVRESLETKARDDPDFWSAVGLIDLQVYEALATRTLASVLAKIEIEYEDLHRRVSASWMWASVHDQMQFVLAKFRVPTVGKRAAGKLLKLLEALATAENQERKGCESSAHTKSVVP